MQLPEYEVGPAGYGLSRRLIGNRLSLPDPRPVVDSTARWGRVKADRRDSARLAELLRARELTAIWVPEVEHEALRKLWRAREDAVQIRMTARRQLKAFPLRQGRSYPGKPSWSKLHARWLAEQKFEHSDDQLAFTECVLAIQSADVCIERLDRALVQTTHGWRFESVVAALRMLRRNSTTSAIGSVGVVGIRPLVPK